MNNLKLIQEYSNGYMLRVQRVGQGWHWNIRNGKLVDGNRVPMTMDDALIAGRASLRAWANVGAL